MYEFDENGLLKGKGLPDGVKLNLDQYSNISKQFANQNKQGFYPTMGADQRTSLAKGISNFRYENGKVKGFVPELEPFKPQGMGDYINGIGGSGNGGKRAGDMVQAYNPSIMGSARSPKGYWVDVDGIVLDESSRSGETKGFNFTIDENGGVPLATFKNGSTVKGYMRLATQQAKTADSLRLGNQSGTASASIRQNAQRRTLL
jgi:hypothetical protein